jgi:Mn2+/Fe2+ NRAMP family transporter
MVLDFSAINPVRAMFWAAVLNGMLAPFMLAGIMLVASDRVLMRDQPSSALSRVVVAITTLAMFAAAIALFLV